MSKSFTYPVTGARLLIVIYVFSLYQTFIFFNFSIAFGLGSEAANLVFQKYFLLKVFEIHRRTVEFVIVDVLLMLL